MRACVCVEDTHKHATKCLYGDWFQSAKTEGVTGVEFTVNSVKGVLNTVITSQKSKANPPHLSTAIQI